MPVKIEKVASVARIFIEENQKEAYQNQIENMLFWFKEIFDFKLPEHQTESYSTTANLEERNYFNDEVIKNENIEEVLFNVPEKKENLILVPKVI